MPRIADYITLWDESFGLDAGQQKGIDFTVPSGTNLTSPTVLLFNLGVFSLYHETVTLSFWITINDIDVCNWSVAGSSIQILTSSHHEVISGQVLRQGTSANRIKVYCSFADTNCYMRLSDVVLMFQRDI